MTINDSNIILNRITEQLSLEEDIVLAIAFGSLVAEGLRPDSDVDIAILTREPLTSQRRETLIRLLAGITGRAVDLIDLRSTGVALMRPVVRYGKRLVCRDRRAYSDLVSRMIMDAADFLPYRQRLLKERRKTWIH